MKVDLTGCDFPRNCDSSRMFIGQRQLPEYERRQRKTSLGSISRFLVMQSVDHMHELTRRPCGFQNAVAFISPDHAEPQNVDHFSATFGRFPSKRAAVGQL